MFVNPIKKRDNTNFMSGQADLRKAQAFVDLNDQQIRQLAYVSSFDREEHRKQNKSVQKYFLAMPVVGTLAAGILAVKPVLRNIGINELGENIFELKSYRPANLGGRAAAMLHTAAGWGALIAGIGVYNSIKTKATSNSPAMKDFQQKNPGLSFLADIGIIMGGYFAAAKGFVALKNTFPEKFVQAETWISEQLMKLNKTKFNKETLPKITKSVAEFAEKNPRIAKGGVYALANSIWILAGLSILKSIHNSHKNHEKVAVRYNQLKDMQLETAKQLASVEEMSED